jgi:hypothetical protein
MDYGKAVDYFRIASENNYSHATMDLVHCFIKGIGAEMNEGTVVEYLNLALRQDRERTMRDIISNHIDVGELIKNGSIKFVYQNSITEVTEQNSYDGLMIVIPEVEYVDPNCFYSSDIRKIFVEKDNPCYSSSGGVIFSKDGKVLVRYPPHSPDSSYVVPGQVEEIGPHAFQNCRNLKNVVLGPGIRRIRDSAFDDCKLMESIDLPDGLLLIGDWAFHGCDSIGRISIGKDVSSIGKYAFGSCVSLTSIDVDSGNDSYSSMDGDLYDKSIQILIQYAIGKKQRSFTVPDSVR